MLVVHADDDGGGDGGAGGETRKGRRVHREAHAALCKQQTFQMCMEIDELLGGCDGSATSVAVDREVMRGWFAKLKKANKAISKYVRAVVNERDRRDVETQILKHSMMSDVLDREATFTQTLEAVVAAEGGNQDRVARAMRFVASVNGALAGLSPEADADSSPSELCAMIRDAAARGV